MNEFTVRLDLAKGKARQQQTVFVRQGDKNATTIVATITDHGAAAATSGMTARFAMRLPNGTEYYRKAASLSGNVATVALDEAQAASVAGRTDVAYFQLLQGSTVVASTESFTVVVLPDALADAEVAESYDSAIQDAIDALDAAVEQMPDMVEDVLAAHPEWTTTVQDGSITKAKLATDLALDRERLLYRLDNLLTNALPEGDVATATDAAKTPVAGLALYGKSTQDGTPTPSAPVPIVSVAPDSQGNISLWARGRNLIDVNLATAKARNTAGTWSGSTYTLNGVSFTFNDDGSVTVNGTATALSGPFVSARGIISVAGTYTLSGCPSGGSDSTYRLDMLRVSSGSFAVDTGSGATFTYDGTYVIDGVRIRVPSGATVSNKTFYPQLEAGSTVHAYQPYTATVTPIPLDGHELRSLPDGTRDEVTVDEYGRVTLVQRVGAVDLGTLTWTYDSNNQYFTSTSLTTRTPGFSALRCSEYAVATSPSTAALPDKQIVGGNGSVTLYVKDTAYTDAASFKAAVSGATLLYKLATPVTIDLGWTDAIPLCGPDLTAQTVPSAEFALTYERDLNATLARLESAIATLA